MRKTHFFAALFLWLLFAGALTGCGREEEPEYFDIKVERRDFPDVIGANPDVYASLLNMQFYQGEPVQIWVVYDGVSKMNIYLYRMDGSRELLREDMPAEYIRGGGFLDQDGNFYYWAPNRNSIIKEDASGKQLFSRQLSEMGLFGIKELYQLGDGRLYARCLEGDEMTWMDRLREMDPSTGDIIKADGEDVETPYGTYIAAGEDGLLCMRRGGIWKIDGAEDMQEEVWSFRGSSYDGDYNADYPVWDFRILEDGSLEMLVAGNDLLAKGADGVAKILRKVAVGEGRTVVVLRGQSFASNTEFKACVRRFNEESEDWYVLLQECGTDDDLWEDYARQTSIEIAAGKGPDILYGDVLLDYGYGIFQKGGIADLGPYLEASGLKREDFFPCVFGRWQSGEKIYSVSVSVESEYITYGSILMDASFLEGNEEPDVETLVNALLDYEGDDVFLRRVDSQGLLGRFLKGSEDLWGMVDWEKRTCDFETELFAGILEVAKRYDGTWKENDARPALAELDSYYVYEYQDKALLEERGKVRVGFLFDDGNHMNASDRGTLTVNANSRKKDGAWEFIQFVLEEGQMIQVDRDRYPASKRAFDIMMASEMSKKHWTRRGGREYYDELNDVVQYYRPLTKERIAELKEILEDARFTPIRTQPILTIIYEEAWGYFNGAKSLEDTIKVINNRVQVYLDEG